jgi:hypothetical protein
MSKKNKLKELNEIYEFICSGYIQKFCKKQDFNFDGWIGDEIGGIASFSEQYFFNLSDIILDLNTKQPKGLILNWQNDGVDVHFKHPSFATINYKSYTMGLRYEQLLKTFKSN